MCRPSRPPRHGAPSGAGVLTVSYLESRDLRSAMPFTNEQELVIRQVDRDAGRVGGRVEPAAKGAGDGLDPPSGPRAATASASRNLTAGRILGLAGRTGRSRTRARQCGTPFR